MLPHSGSRGGFFGNAFDCKPAVPGLYLTILHPTVDYHYLDGMVLNSRLSSEGRQQRRIKKGFRSTKKLNKKTEK